MRLLLPLLLCLWFTPLWGADLPLRGRVNQVFDGDTVAVEGIGRVRLLGIDTPEHESSERDDYLRRHGVPTATLRRIAAAATRRSRELCSGREVTLLMAGDERDRHGRRLAYLILPDGRLLNRLLLDEGLAVVYRRFDFERKSEFIAAEKTARRRHLGLWH